MGLFAYRWGAGLGEKGDATSSYASVAAAQPYGLTALRFRGIRYWWAGLGLVVLGFAYVGPVVAAFRQPPVPARPTPLPQLSIPALGFPLLREPKLHPQAPLPALPRHAATPQHAPVAHATAQKTVAPQRVPVVTDSHAQAPRAKSTSKQPKDPFANATVVEDDIGTPPATTS
jgi:hypothetical protein